MGSNRIGAALVIGTLVLGTFSCEPRGRVAPTLSAKIDKAEQKWQEQGIQSYRIEVLYAKSTWHAQYHQIAVRNGEVVEESAYCIPAPAESGECEVEPFNAEDYTAPGLFSLARSEAQREQGQWTQIEFDPTYGFPSKISFDSPEAIDEELVWRVTAFEVLR